MFIWAEILYAPQFWETPFPPTDHLHCVHRRQVGHCVVMRSILLTKKREEEKEVGCANGVLTKWQPSHSQNLVLCPWKSLKFSNKTQKAFYKLFLKMVWLFIVHLFFSSICIYLGEGGKSAGVFCFVFVFNIGKTSTGFSQVLMEKRSLGCEDHLFSGAQ